MHNAPMAWMSLHGKVFGYEFFVVCELPVLDLKILL